MMCKLPANQKIRTISKDITNNFKVLSIYSNRVADLSQLKMLTFFENCHVFQEIKGTSLKQFKFVTRQPPYPLPDVCHIWSRIFGRPKIRRAY